MKRTVQIIVHGRGNAWPVFLGETHPFYDRTDPRDLSNASYSLMAATGGSVTTDILVDAGHGTIQSMITGLNRIPDAICLTHGHMDHTLGVDWVVQSFWKKHNKEKRYPLYATLPVFRFLITSFPHLAGLIEHRVMEPGIPLEVGKGEQFTVTCYPVYHGRSAVGASMLLFGAGDCRVLFTGDLITPLLRSSDFDALKNVDLMVVDTNNRFPYPGANHWSFSGTPDDPMVRDERLDDFLGHMDPADLTAPHLADSTGKHTWAYLNTFLEEFDVSRHPFTILEFLKKVTPGRVALVHYSGTEDLKYYHEPILTAGELLSWADRTALAAGIRTECIIPSPGQIIQL
jgi:glyoxylase-like metal-dependent hydrolase (beta-lactamase superfamily II)